MKLISSSKDLKKNNPRLASDHKIYETAFAGRAARDIVFKILSERNALTETAIATHGGSTAVPASIGYLKLRLPSMSRAALARAVERLVKDGLVVKKKYSACLNQRAPHAVENKPYRLGRETRNPVFMYYVVVKLNEHDYSQLMQLRKEEQIRVLKARKKEISEMLDRLV